MELKMNQYKLPESVGFNYEELKSELQAKVSQYESLIYSDEQIKEAKADRSQLNKLKKALNDERIRLQKEYMIPFNDFKAKIDELIKIIDKPVGLIDMQVREYEDQKKAEKLEKIKEYWQAKEKPFAIEFERVMDARWLNSSISLKSVYGAIDVFLEGVEKDLATLANLPEFAFESTEVYKSTLDLNKAISEGKRLSEMAKRKAEHEAEQARLAAEAEAKKQEEQLPGQIEFYDAESFEKCMNPPEEVVASVVATAIVDGNEQVIAEIPVEVPEREWISFKALMTIDDAFALKAFFESRNIQFEAI